MPSLSKLSFEELLELALGGTRRCSQVGGLRGLSAPGLPLGLGGFTLLLGFGFAGPVGLVNCCLSGADDLSLVTVPAGFAFGLPVGLTFMGTAYSEPTLIKLAYAFEHATRVRETSRFLANTTRPADGFRSIEGPSVSGMSTLVASQIPSTPVDAMEATLTIAPAT